MLIVREMQIKTKMKYHISLLFKLQQHSGVYETETILTDKFKNIYYLALYRNCLLIAILQSNFLRLNTGFITFFFFFPTSHVLN